MARDLPASPGAACLAFFIFQAGAQADGGLNSISELLGEVVKDSRVIIFTNHQSRFNARWRDLGCEVVVLAMREGSFDEDGVVQTSRMARFTARLANNLRIARTLIAEQVDLVHANDTRSFWSAVLAAKLTGKPIVLNVRDALPPTYRVAPTRWKLAYLLSDLFLVLSKDMEAYWSRLLDVPAGAKLRYLYSIVRPAPAAQGVTRQAARARLGLSDDDYTIAYVASFHPKKLQAEFIEHAAGAILEGVPQARIHFVGDFDPAANPAAARAAEAALGLGQPERLVFEGFSAETWLWYLAADLVVLASEREGLPRCLIEAMCYGAPFASFDVSSAQELADLYRAGSIAPLGDHRALVAAVLDRHHQRQADAETRETRAEAARRLFEPEAARAGYRALVSRLVRKPVT